MIHVLTVHHLTDRWMRPQLEYMERHLPRPWRSYTVADGMHAAGFDEVITSERTQHAHRLNALADHALRSASDDDLLLFLDGDAFPIANPLPTITRALNDGAALVAARRDEGVGAPWPHPLFCAVTAKWWAEHGDWRAGPKYDCRNGEHWSDAGARVLKTLEATGEPWFALCRTNKVNPHPLFLGVYGDLVWHHGAGFRRPISKTDIAQHSDIPARAEHNRRLSEDWYQRLTTDPDFWKELT